tara:strand:- start:348 stop:1301 length:954 start_codon:yes stop_codon:yes gene_type:complete
MDNVRRGMKAKTIKAVIGKKIKSWVESIEDEKVRELVKKNTIVTGGCIASMLLGEKVNDFDIYFTNKETVKAVAEYYVNRFEMKKRNGIPCSITVQDENDRIKVVIKSSGIASEEGTEQDYNYFEGMPDDAAQGYVSEMMDDTGDIQDTYEQTQEMAEQVEDDTYRAVFMSTNAITLSNRIQLVLRFYGDAETIHENYDFVHCTNYWTSKDNNLVLRPEAMEALLSRELRYVGSKYPVCSVIRLRKFIKRGWVINAGQILKMMMQVSELDLKVPEVLEDQLTGVDSAYFIELMTKMRDKDPERINTAYLIEVIDRMF